MTPGSHSGRVHRFCNPATKVHREFESHPWLNQSNIMTKCKTCGKETTNPKFCSLSCAAKTNNKGTRRHGKPPSRCLFCEQETRNPKFCSELCATKHRKEFYVVRYKEIGKAWSGLKQYIIELRGYQCQVCKNTLWCDKPIPLELDHIDGDYNNNSLENLRLICPNCHAQTPTYKSKNNGNGRHYRRERYKNRKSY